MSDNQETPGIELIPEENMSYYETMRALLIVMYGEERFEDAKSNVIESFIFMEDREIPSMGTTVISSLAAMFPTRPEIQDFLEAFANGFSEPRFASAEGLDTDLLAEMMLPILYTFGDTKEGGMITFNSEEFARILGQVSFAFGMTIIRSGGELPKHIVERADQLEAKAEFKDRVSSILSDIEINGVDASEFENSDEECVYDGEYSPEIREMLQRVAKNLGVDYVKVVEASNSVSDMYPDFCTTVHNRETCVRCQILQPDNEELIEVIASIGGLDGSSILEFVPEFDTRVLETLEKHGVIGEMEAYSTSHAHCRMGVWVMIMRKVYNM
jgi:hypothetical protein